MRKKIFYVIFSIFLLLILPLGILFYYRSDNTKSLIVPTITSLDTQAKVLALTFDDGPSEKKTSLLLDLLKEKNAHVTFFVTGHNAELYPDLIERMNEEDHLVANHSNTHKRLIFQLPAVVKEEVEKADTILQNLGIEPNKYFRPPYLDEMLILPLILKEKNKVIVSYDVDPQEQYKSDFKSNEISDYVVKNVKPGSIVVLHDGNETNTEEFIKAVDNIIVELTKQGYRFVTLDF